MSLFTTGAVAPQDPLTGLVVGKIWQADEILSLTVTYPGEVTQHPLQTGATVSDAILERPALVRVEFRVTAHGCAPGMHPTPAFRGREYLLAGQLSDIQKKRGPVRLWLRGLPPLRDYAFGNLSRTDDGENKRISLSCDFVALEFASLFEVPLAADAELLAAGLIVP